MGGGLWISGCSPKLGFVRFLMFPRIENLDALGNQFLCSVNLTIIIYFCLNGVFCLSACAHWLLLCHWIPLRVWLCFLTSSHQIFVHIDRIPLRLLHAEQVHFSACQILLFLQHFFDPPLDILLYVLVSFVLENRDLDTVLLMCLIGP